jgi:hypothetical protein
VTWPEPRPGLVIRYTYLWDREARTGREEGTKDRPCAVVLAVRDENGDTRVYVLPTTHAAPRTAAEAVELPPTVKRHLGLDDARSWVVLTEANVFTWPGPDLRPMPGQGPGSVAYGYLPPRLLRTIRDRFVALYRERRSGLVARSE